jgi:hypothetical protein
MKPLACLLALLLLCPLAGALADRPAGEQDTPDVPGAPQRPQPGRDDEQRPSSGAAGTFTPSEKVGADSAVSFPVDI